MNYSIIYNNLIEKAKARPTPNCYTEKHHIMPKSLGGSDDSDNLVALTAREHFIAHLLLAKIYGGPMITAIFTMMVANNKKYNARQYEWIRKEFSNIQSQRLKGKKLSEETKRKMSVSRKGRKVSDDTKEKISMALKGRKQSPEHLEKNINSHKGIILSEETKKKMSEIKQGKKHTEEAKEKMKKPKSEETKLKMSVAKKGHVVSEETKRKISETKKKKVI